MTRDHSIFTGLSSYPLIVLVLILTACGTLEVAYEDAGTRSAVPLETVEIVGLTSELASTEGRSSDTAIEVKAWYGSIHSVDASQPEHDYLKLWHLDIWPKYGRAVGIDGADSAIDAEITRLRDNDTKAAFWGDLTCGVADYGACQLRVTRLSANDGGPTYPAEEIDGWEGTIGRLPRQPGSRNDIYYFVLAGDVPVLYGIASSDPSLQEQLETVPENEVAVRIWGELGSKAQPVTGTLIDVTRLDFIES
jgi:hypothetical protein